MSIDKCPGQDSRFWKPSDVFEAPCPHCGASVEFWKDEPRRRCRSCGKTAPNPKFDMGCAKWCKFADACLGRHASSADEALCDSILAEVKNTFGPDERRVRHALDVLDYAEKILSVEKGDPLVVRAAALLHDIGIREAERVHGSAAGKFQELEGPPIARRILEHLGVDKERTDHIARIVGSHHSAAGIDTAEFRIIWDADRLANIPEECAGKTLDQALSFVRRAYRTDTGRALGEAAVERYLSADSLPRKT
jgi:HD superfamily phosphodiesterase